MKEIRTLTAAEIDCRVGMVSQRTKKVSILLYKNARVDMAILDELVGPENWQRDHKEIKGNLYCGVGINTEAAGWAWKWDCGVESNTEKEKGEASDSFKRACVNWGIGRELYTAPSIWIECSDQEWNGGKPFVDFRVSHIAYNDKREITELEIVDKTAMLRYHYGLMKKTPKTPTQKKAVSLPDASANQNAEANAEAQKPLAAATPNKIFCPEKYPTAWSSAVKRARETGDITRLDIEDRGFIVTPENWERFTKEINS